MQVNLHAYNKNKWNSPRLPNQVNLDNPHNHWTNFIPTLKSSQIRPLHWNQVNFDQPHIKQSILKPILKTEIFGQHQISSHSIPPTQQPNHCHLYTEIRSSSIPHIEITSISSIARTKSVSMSTLKTINSRSAHKKRGQFWPPHKNHVHFGPHTETNSMSLLHTKPS